MQHLTLSGDSNLPDIALKDSEVNHLRQLLAWLRCEYYLDEHFQRGMLSAADSLVQMGKNPEEVSAMLQANADKINKVPAYVRQAHKMLTKALQKHEKASGLVNS